MNFTDSPFERMMKQVPRPSRGTVRKPPIGSPCRGCGCWNGTPCVGVCCRELLLSRREATAVRAGNGCGKSGKTEGYSVTLFA